MRPASHTITVFLFFRSPQGVAASSSSAQLVQPESRRVPQRIRDESTCSQTLMLARCAASAAASLLSTPASSVDLPSEDGFSSTCAEVGALFRSPLPLFSVRVSYQFRIGSERSSSHLRVQQAGPRSLTLCGSVVHGLTSVTCAVASNLYRRY